MKIITPLFLPGILGACLFSMSCTPTQRGAGTGAAIGAGSGAIIGNQSGNAGEGALIGAAVGGLGGALIGDAGNNKHSHGDFTHSHQGGRDPHGHGQSQGHNRYGY